MAAAPIDEGDFRVLANVEDGIRNAVVNVLNPIESLIVVQGICVASTDSNPSAYLNWICFDCVLCDDISARDMSLVTVNNLDGLSSLITVDVRSEVGQRRASQFYTALCNRLEPFDLDYETNFALVVFGGGDHPMVNRICQRLVNMGANELLPARYIDVLDSEAETAAVIEWRNDLEEAFVSWWHTTATQQQVFVAKAENPQEVFQIYSQEAFHPISLSHNGIVTGYIYQGFVLRRHGDSFLLPSMEDAEIVAIKLTRIATVNDLLAHGHQENPWKGIYRQQSLGDDIHVPRLSIGRALSDGTHLYQITKWRDHGSLDRLLARPLPFLAVRDYFMQMLECLQYIHGRGVCHHDIKPANFLVDNGRLLLTDFAMSFIIPPGGLVHHGNIWFGTPAMMLPDHFRREAYNAQQYDLWGCMCSFFCLLTGFDYIYQCPSDENVLFAYVIQSGLLSTHCDIARLRLIEDRVMDRIQEALRIFDSVASQVLCSVLWYVKYGFYIYT
jgi:serine/threonine protein kinase